MSDAVQIINTLDNTRVTQKNYSDVQWQFIYDEQKGAYNNYVNYITTILKPYFVDYHNAYLYIPVTIKSSDPGSPYTGGEGIAYRESILQMFNDINIATDTGATIVNESQSAYWINMIRPRLENDFDFFEVNGGELQMAREIDHWLNVQKTNIGSGIDNGFLKQGSVLSDQWANGAATHIHGNDVQGTTSGIVWNDPNKDLYGLFNNNATAASGAITLAASTTDVPIKYNSNPFYNPSFATRIGLFKSMYTFTGSSYEGIVMMPLRLIHDFFQQLNMAVINLGFNFKFTFAQTNNQTDSQTPVFMTNGGFRGVTTTPPMITYGNSTTNATRLYYRSMKFNASDASRMKEKLMDNFVKSINFVSTDFRQMRGGSVNVSTGGSEYIQTEITSSVVYPLRVWALCYPTPAASSATAAPLFPMGVMPYYFENSNLLINNVPYFRTNLQWPQQQWLQLKDQFSTNVEGQAAITYEQFVRYNHWQVFDIDRLGLERITSPTEPVSLAIQGNLTCPSDVDFNTITVLFMIERMNEITFRFSSSDVSVVVGNISLNNTA